MPEDGVGGVWLIQKPVEVRQWQLSPAAIRNKLQLRLPRLSTRSQFVARHTKAAHTASRQQFCSGTTAESGHHQPPLRQRSDVGLEPGGELKLANIDNR